MSRVTRWKVEKTKVKVVFRLQFHATHIPQPGWDKLFISLVPADTGKATAKTTKANVRSGACKWGDPIYETTRLLQDLKTKQYDDKFYKLVIAMGSSRSSVLGEANINLAHFADALKPYAVQLPLQDCDSGAILHVTIQLLTSKTGFREFELQRELREKGLQSTSDESSARKISSSEDGINDQMEKTNTRVRFKEESTPLEEVGVNEEYANSATGFDDSSTASEGLYVDKHDTSSTHEIDSLKSTTSGDLVGPSLSQSPQPEKVDPSDPRFLPLGSNDWSHGWGSDYSADNDFVTAHEENNRLRRSLETAESSVLELKLEVNSLRSHADEIGTESQRFSKVLATEIASGERLASEVSVLRSECANLKADLVRIRNTKSKAHFITKETTIPTQDAFLQELQHRWCKGLREVEDKVKEIQSKASFGLHEKDFRSFNSDLETLQGVLHDLRQGSVRTISGFHLGNVKDTREISLLKAEQFLPGTRFGADFYQPDGLLHSLDIAPLVPQEIDSADSHSAMKGFELLKELDESKAEREALTRKMDQMECYYEALVQELEETQRQMMGELQNLRNEHSTCLYTISATKAEMESMHQEMNKQVMRFSEEKCELGSLNKDLERRAVGAEAALKRARLNYSVAVNQLQKDLEVLSVQVLSMHETSENLIKQAFSDSSPASVLGCEDVAGNTKLDKEIQVTKLTRCQSQFDGVKKQQLEGEIISEDLKKSLLLQKGLYQKVEEEVYEVHLVNVHLDIFSKTLQESLLGASVDFRLLKERVYELTQNLEISTESNMLLMQRFEGAMDEVRLLSEYKEACDLKCNDLALQNHVLETKLQNIIQDKYFLSEKIAECEAVIEELGSYKDKFQACSTEKVELERLLKKEVLENGDLKNEMALLQEELKAVATKFDEVASVKENLQTAVSFMHSKLQNLLEYYHEKYNDLSICTQVIDGDSRLQDLAGVLTQFEELQCSSCEKIFQLIVEKQMLAEERDVVKMSLSKAESDNQIMKHKFEENRRSVMEKLNGMSILVEKLQSEFEATTNRLKSSSEAEETYVQLHKELLSGFDHLEVEVQQLAAKSEGLGQEIMALESMNDELGSLKLTMATLLEEKESLALTLRDRNEVSTKLEMEFNSLRSDLQSLEAELDNERSVKSKLQDMVTDLNSQLKDKNSMLLNFEQKDAELVRLGQLVAELELEKLSVCRTLSDSEKSLKAAREEFSSISSLEAQISEMHECCIASEVRHTFVQTQYESCIEDILKKFLSGETKLHRCLASEAHYIEENAKLMTSLSLLRSEFDASIAQNRVLLETNSGFVTELDELKKDVKSIEADSLLNTEKHALEIGRLETKLRDCLASEAQYTEDNAKLMSTLSLLRADYDTSVAQIRALIDTNSGLVTKLDELKKDAESIEADSLLKTEKHAFGVERFENMRVKYEEDIENLIAIKEELEILLLVFKLALDSSVVQNGTLLVTNSCLRAEIDVSKKMAESLEASSDANAQKHSLEIKRLEGQLLKYEEKIDNLALVWLEQEIQLLVIKLKLDEQKPQIALVQEYKHELMILQNKYDEITQKLSEQILKTEEFKNLSIHLKELKDKADAECLQAREEEEVLPPAVQESLRMVFIKEQYETKVQEMKQQLSISKKHSDEMLWKLQDAVDEVENRKKSEASSLKRIEELGKRILELESDLQSTISEKREMMNAYDLMKAEKECSLISLDCCKEEKQELEVSLHKCNEEKSKISVELSLMKDYLESSRFEENNQLKDTGVLRQSDRLTHESANRSLPEINSASGDSKELEEGEAEAEVLPPINEADQSITLVTEQQKQDTSGSINSFTGAVHIGQDNVLNGDTNHLALVNDHFKGQSIRSSMDHLNKELEKMKYESLLLPEDADDHQLDQCSPSLQRELMQLNKVNEELGYIFPTFKEFSCQGNALERVLALEIELAEALQEKKKSTLHFQSSFLKQHSDEEAVFKSFRDINELIKDTLEIKGRYAVVETELKEMHNRYSELSLQFAEVEGERQKLMMTLKNVRASKRVPFLNRSSTSPLGSPLS